MLDAAFNKDPVMDKLFSSDELDEVNQYGYAFWFRFLTRYPETLLDGKNAPWYFLARLTKNNPYGDIGVGDRTLAIW